MTFLREQTRHITNFIEHLTGHKVSESDELMLGGKIKEIIKTVRKKEQDKLVNFVKSIADATDEDIDLILLTNTKETLINLRNEAKKLINS